MATEVYIKVPAAAVVCPALISTLLLQTNAQSFITGDDGDDSPGRATDHFTLAVNNGFGNTNRYTDTLGGATYTNDIVVDWSQQDTNGDVMMYHRVKQSSTTLALAIAAAKAATVDTFANWEVPNLPEAQVISNWDNGSNRATGTPFTSFGAGGVFWTKTLQNASVAWNYTYLGNGIIGRIGITGSQQYFMVRKTPLSELGL